MQTYIIWNDSTCQYVQIDESVPLLQLFWSWISHFNGDQSQAVIPFSKPIHFNYRPQWLASSARIQYVWLESTWLCIILFYNLEKYISSKYFKHLFLLRLLDCLDYLACGWGHIFHRGKPCNCYWVITERRPGTGCSIGNLCRTSLFKRTAFIANMG